MVSVRLLPKRFFFEMVFCAVATCNVRSGRDKDVAFFGFPESPNLRKAWIWKCGRKGLKPSKHAKVCEAHFVDSDFIVSRSFADSLNFCQKLRLRLKPDAIPSIIAKPKKISKLLQKKNKSPRKSKALEKRQRLKVNVFLRLGYV